MIWIVLLFAVVWTAALLACTVWILGGWTPADDEPSDRLERLRQVVKR